MLASLLLKRTLTMCTVSYGTFLGAFGGVPFRQDTRVLQGWADLHPPKDPERDSPRERSLDLQEAGGGTGKPPKGQGCRRRGERKFCAYTVIHVSRCAPDEELKSFWTSRTELILYRYY